MTRGAKVIEVVFVVAALGLAVALRLSLLDFKSVDYFSYTKVWYITLKDSGFAAFSQGFSNYNLPYLYLLYLVVRIAPDLSSVAATKVPSLIADFVAAWYAFRIVGLKFRASPVPKFAALAVLLAPTIVLNSAFWGQADALYACAVLASIYYVLRGRHAAAMVLFGVAVAFKAQAVFVLPVLAALILRKQVHWKHVFLVPGVMILALIPAWLAGRPLLDLLLIYPSQAGQYEQLSMHAPSALAWIPDTGKYYTYFYSASLILAATLALGFCVVITLSKTRLTPSLLLRLALVAAILLPFLLPKMHERYFYVADLLSVILPFFEPTLFFVPLVMASVSFFAYQPTLFGAEPVSIAVLALGMLGLLILLGRDVLRNLYPPGLNNEEPSPEVE